MKIRMDCPKDLIKNLVNFKKQWYLENEVTDNCKEVLRHLGVNCVGGYIFKNHNTKYLHINFSLEKKD